MHLKQLEQESQPHNAYNSINTGGNIAQNALTIKTANYLTKTMKLIQPIRYRLPIPTHWQLEGIINLLLIVVTFSISLCFLLNERSNTRDHFNTNWMITNYNHLQAYFSSNHGGK